MAGFILRNAEPKDVSDILRLIKVKIILIRIYTFNVYPFLSLSYFIASCFVFCSLFVLFVSYVVFVLLIISGTCEVWENGRTSCSDRERYAAFPVYTHMSRLLLWLASSALWQAFWLGNMNLRHVFRYTDFFDAGCDVQKASVWHLTLWPLSNVYIVSDKVCTLRFWSSKL